MANKKIILAVDDMPENLTTVKIILQDYFDVRLAKSAKAAISVIQEQDTQVDLILLDIEMPNMSGFHFLDFIHSKYPDSLAIPVIFVTSHALADFINQAINRGARDYLVKPIQGEVLLKKVADIIGLPDDEDVGKPPVDTFAKWSASYSQQLVKEMFRELHLACFTQNTEIKSLRAKVHRLSKDMPESIYHKFDTIITLLDQGAYNKADQSISELETSKELQLWKMMHTR